MALVHASVMPDGVLEAAAEAARIAETLKSQSAGFAA
jgi:hypothetical protein